MIRLSMLRNYPVICKNEKVGLLQSVSIDEAQKQVAALIVSCGFKGKRLVPSQNILSIADGFILVDRIERFRRQKDSGSYPLVRDTSGQLAGRVIDYAIDENTLDVYAVEMIPGYLPYEYRRKLWVYEYSQSSTACSEIVIPAGIGQEPIWLAGGE